MNAKYSVTYREVFSKSLLIQSGQKLNRIIDPVVNPLHAQFQCQYIKPMPSDKNPVFRKAIIPWYNSTTVYIIVLIIMLLVLFFAIDGISVSREYSEYQGYIWVPALLLAMTAAIIITLAARLIKRYTQKSKKSI